MPGLVPGIHAFLIAKQDVDGRVKPGHDVGPHSTATNPDAFTTGPQRLRSSLIVSTNCSGVW
jgi:hypothetical protein